MSYYSRFVFEFQSAARAVVVQSPAVPPVESPGLPLPPRPW